MEATMREVCEQCQRFIPSWREPVLQVHRIFCSETCAELHEMAEDTIHGALKPLECYQIPASRPLVHVARSVI
jgi:hypothetical protein